jgi:hypothetical protein
MNVRILIASLAFPIAACASTAEPEPTRATAAADTTTSNAPNLAGRYAFSLEESAVATPLRARCASESGGDDAKARACFDAVKAEGDREGLRFETDASGTLSWISYAFDAGSNSEVVVHRAPIALESATQESATYRTTAAATGVAAEKRPMPAGTIMRFALLDATTIAMDDPDKGRLVFHHVP